MHLLKISDLSFDKYLIIYWNEKIKTIDNSFICWPSWFGTPRILPTVCMHAQSWVVNTNRPFSGCKDINYFWNLRKHIPLKTDWPLLNKTACKMTVTISTRVPCDAENQWVVLTHIYRYTYTVTVKHVTFKT